MSAASSTKPSRPVALTLTPVPMLSTHDHTPTPSPTPSMMARPPTPGGGPLSSHPTTPIGMGGRYTPPPFPTDEIKPAAPHDSPLDYHPISPSTTIPPMSLESAAAAYAAAGQAPCLSRSRPASAHLTSFSPPKTAPATLPRSTSGGLKRLLSLSSLRSSFQTSRTPSDLTTMSTNNSSTTWFSSPASKRAATSKSPVVHTGYAASIFSMEAPPTPAPKQTLSKRRSGAWFRRASVLLSFDDPKPRADSIIDESAYEVAPATSFGGEAVPRAVAAPLLPEIPELGFRSEDWGNALRGDLGKA